MDSITVRRVLILGIAIAVGVLLLGALMATRPPNIAAPSPLPSPEGFATALPTDPWMGTKAPGEAGASIEIPPPIR